MQKVLVVLLVLTIFVCIFNYPEYSVFQVKDFFEWFEDLEDPPSFFSDWNDEADTWLEKIGGGVADLFMILSFPVRFIIWIVPRIIDFISTFVLFGVF